MTLTDELIRLANELGSDEEYSRAGGGNASVKVDGILYIKPSGVPLATLRADDLIPLRIVPLLDALHSDQKVDGDPVQAAARAAQLHDANGRRPSVEILFHALIPDPLVIHLHPLTSNAVTCNEHGEYLTKQILGDDALWVDYLDPGIPLARGIEEARGEFTRRTGKPAPQITLLGNHGIIVSGDSYAQIISLTRSLTQRIQDAIDQASDSGALRLSPSQLTGAALVLQEATGKAAHALSNSGIAIEESALSAGPVSSGPLIPDQIVYAASLPVILHPPYEPSAITRAVSAYHEEHGHFPIIAVLPQRGVIALGADAKAARNALDTFLDALRISRDANRLGRVRTLTHEERSFIEKWEAEAYRRSIAAQA